MARRKPTNTSHSADSILEAIQSGNKELSELLQQTSRTQNNAISEIALSLQKLAQKIEAADEQSASDNANVEMLSEANDNVVNELQTASLLHQLMNDTNLADHTEGSSETTLDLHAESDGNQSATICQCCLQNDEPIIEMESFAPVDVDNLSDEELRAALIEQERVVAKLATIVKQRQQRQPVFSAQQLQEIVERLPDDMEQLVRKSLDAIEQQASISELQLSLDRARVSRQVSQLEETRQRLDARAKTLGVTITEDGQLENTSKKEHAGSKSRRWLGALGFSH